MIYFQCFDCGHCWNTIFWEEREGVKIACPQCKSLNVQRIEKIRGWDQENSAGTHGHPELQVQGNPQQRSEQKNQSKDDGQPSSKFTKHRLASSLRIDWMRTRFNDINQRFIKHSP